MHRNLFGSVDSRHKVSSGSICFVSDGAQLIEIELDGTEKLRAVYSDDAKKFIPVE